MSEFVHALLRPDHVRRADAMALSYKGESLTYGMLSQHVGQAAAGFVGLGIDRGDRVAVYLEKRLEAVIAQFGAAAAGGAFVPINPLLRARQAGYILETAGAKVLVTSTARLDSLSAVIAGCRDLRMVVLVDEGPLDPAVPWPPRMAWADLLADGAANHKAPHRIIDTDMAAILFTSGSTGMPKGVVLSHRNLVASGRSAAEHIGNVADDRVLVVLPFSFDYGIVQVTSTFSVGGTVVLMNYLFPNDVVKAVTTHGITGLAGVPPLWIQLAQAKWPEEATDTLRYISNSGGAMPQATLKALRAALPRTRINLMYGLTEAFRSTCLPPAEVDRLPTSIGKPIPNAEIIVVREDGSPCKPGELGECVHRGPFVSLGYWNNPEATAERFRPFPVQRAELKVPEVAVWSGDLVWYDEEGFFYFVGRRDDQIKSSGFRVSPTEVEDIIYSTGLVGEVVVVGVPHPVRGQAIVAVATAPAGGTLDKKAILDRCQADMPTYMVPLLVVEVQSIPRTPNGKMDRKVFAAEFATVFESADA